MSEKKGISPVEELNFVKLLWPRIKDGALRLLVMYLQYDALPTELSKLPFIISGECQNCTGDLVHAKHVLY